MKATIEVQGSAIAKLLASEQHHMVNERAEYSVTTQGDTTIITITAKDATALRAVQNSICKILIVYEKAQEVI